MSKRARIDVRGLFIGKSLLERLYNIKKLVGRLDERSGERG